MTCVDQSARAMSDSRLSPTGGSQPVKGDLNGPTSLSSVSTSRGNEDRGKETAVKSPAPPRQEEGEGAAAAEAGPAISAAAAR